MGGGVGVVPTLSPKARLSSLDSSAADMSSLLNLPPSWPMALAVRGLPPLPPLLALVWLVAVGRSARFMLSTRWARSLARVEARLTTSRPELVRPVSPW